MSWLDSSYSFARTAFSQAQKSIDKVLDISEQKKENEEKVTDSSKPDASSSPARQSGETSKSDSFSSTWGGSDTFSAFFKWTEDSSTVSPDKVTASKSNRACEPASSRPVSRARISGSSIQRQTHKLSSPSPIATPVKNEEGGEIKPDKETSEQTNVSPLTSTPIGEARPKKTATPTVPDEPVRLSSDTRAKMPAMEGKNPAMGSSSMLVEQNMAKSIQIVEESMKNQPVQLTESESNTSTMEIGRSLANVSTPVDPTILTSASSNVETLSAMRPSPASVPDASITSNESLSRTHVVSMEDKVNSDEVEQVEPHDPDLHSSHCQVSIPATTEAPLSSDLVTSLPPPLSPPQQDLLEMALSEHEDCEQEVSDHKALVVMRNSGSGDDTGVNAASELLKVKVAVESTTVLEADEPAVLPPSDHLYSPTFPIQEPSFPEQNQPFLAAEVSSSGQPATEQVDGSTVVKSDDVKMTKLEEELLKVQKILDIRESKLLQMSQESIDLHDTNQELQRKVHEFQGKLQSREEELESLRDQSTRKITTTEKKLQAVLKERDSLKKQVHVLESQHSQQKDSVEQKFSELIKEKDEQIAGLMEEGETLSKKQLQSSNIIKKLRAKEKEKEQVIATLNQQILDQESEVKHLKELIQKKEENEKKYQESLSHLNAIAEQQDKELRQLKPEKEQLLEKARSLQVNLDNAYKELTEMRKSTALSQSVAQEAALSAHQSAKDELKQVMEEQRLQLQKEKDNIVMQIRDLQMSLSRAEQQSSWREDQLRQEITDLQQRLQEADARNQDLSNSISEATRPLLRQIEHIQSAHAAQASNWEKVETSLTQRLVDAQTQLSIASEKERSVQEREMTLQSRVGVLEAQSNSLRQEKSQLVAALELEKTKLQALKEEQQRDGARHEALRSSLVQKLEETRKEKEMLERQLEYERVRLEAESKKAMLELQEKERLKTQLAHSLTSMVHRSLSSTSSHHDEIQTERTLSLHEGSVNEGNLYGRNASLGSASIIEQLQSLLKQREGELANSQSMVHSLERSLSAMTEELANVSAKSEMLQSKVGSIPFLTQQLQEVQSKYEAMLQMYGEKAEEAEELRLDIQDLKTMYRQQIEDLVSQR